MVQKNPSPGTQDICAHTSSVGSLRRVRFSKHVGKVAVGEVKFVPGILYSYIPGIKQVRLTLQVHERGLGFVSAEATP